MTQLHFTLDYEFFTGLFSDSKEDAFAKLMKSLLDQVLQAESKTQLGAEHYERSEVRNDYRNGTRERTLVTRIGKITLDVPRHRDVPFSTAVFERYKRNEQALIATMAEMVLQGVSTRKVQKVTEELCGCGFSKSAVSEMFKTLDVSVLEFKNRQLDKEYPFVIVDALYIKVREGRKVHSKAFMWALGIDENGNKEVIAFEVCDGETKDSWSQFFNNLKGRGLKNVDIIISDSHQGLVSAIKECFVGTSWQRCQFHFARNIIDKTPKKYQTGLAQELREMFTMETLAAARTKKEEIIKDYKDVATKAMECLDEGFEDSMAIMALPKKYRISLRTSNIVERENREIRRRENVIQIFPNEAAAIRLIGALLLDHTEDWIGAKRVFDMKEYYDDRETIKNESSNREKTA